MPRILLLCFIHGFKGNDDTFHEFPYDLKKEVSRHLPDQRIESVVYPTYETKGELAQATEAFLGWLKERVMDVRKTHLEKPWPPHDRDVGVILVAHSMGGFVAADTLFLALKERDESDAADKPLFPLIQGILTFDTPYNGLARSMFVYGAFSNYQKVSSVFNVMTALGAAAPAGLRSLATQRASRSAALSASSSRSNPGWKAWQLIAVRTGTVGAIAAGGVAAYVHREAIMKGVQSMRGLNRESVAEGYRQGMETLGQGLAYVNRGSVGHSFAWLSDHFTFVGALLKQKELSRRLDRMGALRGVGIRDLYVSLGENGYWSGGYFVPERTFCAVPDKDHSAHGLFSRYPMADTEDEVQAHMTMFKPDKNNSYERMTDEAAELVKTWFLSEEEAVDDPSLREASPDETAEDNKVEETLKESEKAVEEGAKVTEEDADDDGLPDESPLDIAAAASMVPLPEDSAGDLVGPSVSDDASANERKRTYRQYLFSVAQQTGNGAAAWLPSKMPQMPQMPSVSMPSMPQVPSAVSSLGQVSMPSLGIFGKKKAEDKVAEGEKSVPEEKQGETEVKGAGAEAGQEGYAAAPTEAPQATEPAGEKQAAGESK
ncbi:hypothetical protein F5X68DRAFT_168281 [Plectosphaerella plurivora]|uniref:DUF676 domain-containing protein n=1 Tax=Plectosphaerella plurivora TaxID=936078 RepID=A0A9P8VCE1_9PEZI|nr:hypothetical protein F5X68DRAFT_168281 [Plectosphaerella plurivora]